VIVETRFLKKATSPNSFVTWKIVEVWPILLPGDKTKICTSSFDDSWRVYDSVESENVEGLNAPTFRERTATREGMEL
jgi:hypothetical protein